MRFKVVEVTTFGIGQPSTGWDQTSAMLGQTSAVVDRFHRLSRAKLVRSCASPGHDWSGLCIDVPCMEEGDWHVIFHIHGPVVVCERRA